MSGRGRRARPAGRALAAPRLDELVTRVVTRAPTGGPWVGVEHLLPGRLRLTPRALVHEGLARASDGGDTAFQAGDVVVSRARPEQRKLALAMADGACSPELWVLRPRPGVDPHAVLYALAAPAVSAAWAAGASGTGIPRVPWGLAAATRLPLLPAATVAHLVAVDDGIAARDRVLAATRRLLLAASHAGGRAPRPGRVGDHAREVRILVAAGAASPDTPCVGLEHLSRGGLGLGGWGRFGDARSEKVRFRVGDLLVGRIRPSLHKLALAPIDGVASPDIVVLRPLSPSGFALAVGALLHPDVPEGLGARGRGTHVPRVRAADILGLPAPGSGALQAPEGVAADAALLHAVAIAAEAHRLRVLRDIRLGLGGSPAAG